MNLNKILVADDEPHLIRSLEFILKKAGYEVIMAANGEEALVKIAEFKPGMIFLDIMMPKKNGYEVCEIIKNSPEYKNVYIIFLSAKGGDIDREKALSLGADEFMSKPFSPMDVLARTKIFENKFSAAGMKS
jgi:two-component system, OmpR family, alkaline phosphatase synthesis response regulator PhoP